jgi:glutamate racemase
LSPSVGVFDSGVGGLSVLRALRQALPAARFTYLADNAWAPYGERPADMLNERIDALVRAWRAHHALDLLVLACNTATAVAVDTLRREHPDLPIVGMEPAIRPALAATRSQHIGVLATRGTLHSARYHRLRANCQAVAPEVQIHDHAADGLADAIERGDETAARSLCHTHLNALLARAPAIDTLVLGCTHYPLADPVWWGTPLALIDPAAAVARRAGNLLGVAATGAAAPATIDWHCTGSPVALGGAAARWLGLEARVQPAPFCP